jgi:phosphate starvation-inducible PhoH-like protein
VDLPNKKDSGLMRGVELTKNIKGIKTITFKNEDIVRHPLVAKIVKAFEKGEQKGEQA